MMWQDIYEASLRILIYLVVNLNHNNAHFANFASSTAHFARKLLIAFGSLLCSRFC